MGYYSYLFFFIPVLIFTLFAQLSVDSTFNKFNKVANRRRMTGADAARLILQANGLHDVRIEQVAGNLTDHFDPRENVIRLSESVYGVASIAAVGVAAHEAGHAVQYAVGYGPIKSALCHCRRDAVCVQMVDPHFDARLSDPSGGACDGGILAICRCRVFPVCHSACGIQCEPQSACGTL